MLAFSTDESEPEQGGVATAVATPQAVHEVAWDLEELTAHKQDYIVVRVNDEYSRVLAVVELLSFAKKQGSYSTKYREKRAQFLAGPTHFMEIDFLRAGTNPSREPFPELPATPYFVFVVRKTGLGRTEEGYPITLQQELPTIGLPLGPQRPDLPLDLAAAFCSAYDLSDAVDYKRAYLDPPPDPKLSNADQAWIEELLGSKK